MSKSGALLASLESLFTVMLAAYFLKERLTPKSMLAVLIALCGVLVIEFTGGFSGVHLGDGMVLIAILAASAYAIVASTIAAGNDAFTMTAYQFAVGLLFVIPFALTNWLAGVEQLVEPRHATAWIAAIGVGVFGYAGSFLLYNFALAHVRAGIASMSLNLLPLSGLLSAVIFLGEPLTWAGCLGGALILGALFVFTRNSAETDQPHQKPAAVWKGRE